MIPVNKEMRFETTTECDYDCIICRKRDTDRESRTMSLDLFKMLFNKIVDETDQYTALSFAGTGDPLCDPGLEDKIRYAKKRRPNLDVPIVTNGYRMTPTRFRSLQDAGVDTIRISFHGDSPETYFETHRRNAFDKVRKNVLSALDNKTTTKITLALVVVPNNEHIVDSWLNLWKDERISLVEVWRAHNWIDYHNYRKLQKEQVNTCGRVFSGPLQIQVDGTVNMCCMDFLGELLLGDLKTQSLKEIFEGAFYTKLARCHTDGIFTNGLLCRKCEQRNKDKTEACLYSSRYTDMEDRVKRVSTTYERFQ